MRGLPEQYIVMFEEREGANLDAAGFWRARQEAEVRLHTMATRDGQEILIPSITLEKSETLRAKYDDQSQVRYRYFQHLVRADAQPKEIA